MTTTPTTTNENSSYPGKVAFVTGAANGIGRATALASHVKVPSVVVADVAEAGQHADSTMIEDLGGSAFAVRCDVSHAEDVKAALAKTIEVFGRLDFAFNNAGIEPRKPAPTAEYDEEEWDRIFAINLRGVFLCMKHEIPLILKQGGGHRQHLFGRRCYRHQGQPRLHRREARRHRTHRAAALDYAAQDSASTPSAPAISKRR